MTFTHVYTDGMLWFYRHGMQSSCGRGKLDKNILFKHLMRRNYLAHYNKIQLRKMGCWGCRLNSTASGQTSVMQFWANGNRRVGFHNRRQNLQLDGRLSILLWRTLTMESVSCVCIKCFIMGLNSLHLPKHVYWSHTL
jgi:hypothetical protein